MEILVIGKKMQTSVLCSACSGRLIADPESGEMVCSHCGLVLSDRTTDSRPEWRSFESEASTKERVGAPASLAVHDMGLSTIIGKNNSDSTGRKLDASMHATMQRLRIWDFRTQAHTSSDRNLLQAFDELRRCKGKLGLSDATIEKAAYIYRKAQERRLIQGRSTSAMMAAAVYAACREMGISRTLGDIAAITDSRHKTISRCYRLLVNELDIRIPLADPMKCIAKVANNLHLDERTKRSAMSIMNTLTKEEISAGKLPMALAATVLYISCLKNGENMTQKRIAEAAGVTEVTIRNRIKDLRVRLKLL